MMIQPSNFCLKILLNANRISNAVFVLCLDSAHESIVAGHSFLTADATKKQTELDGLHLLHGFGPSANGLNRWFDATIQALFVLKKRNN